VIKERITFGAYIYLIVSGPVISVDLVNLGGGTLSTSIPDEPTGIWAQRALSMERDP
jgi:hypothetical protein